MAKDLENTLRTLRKWSLAIVVLTLLLFAAQTLLGTLNQDEGWYLYAAREVMRGHIPHRDFFFTQGLGFPIIYAAFGWLWSGFGLLGGRLFTAALSIAALFVADRTVVSCCRKPEDRWMARIVLWSLLGLNLWYTYFTAIPKAYALCALGLAIAFRLLSGLIPEKGIDPWCALGAGLLVAFLTDVRLSMGILLPTVTLWLLFRRAWAGRLTWLWFALGGAAGLLVAFGPELLLWPQSLIEAQSFHAARASMGFLGIPGCLARLLRFNPVLTLLGLLLGWLWFTRKPALKAPSEDRAALLQLWLVCAAALLVVHLIAPVPYDDYLVPMLLPLAMAVAFAFTGLPFDSLRLALAKVIPLAALALSVFASPIAQDWFVLRQDRFWVQTRLTPDLLHLKRAAADLRIAAQRLNTDTVWTQDTYLAVEAGLRVPKGLEMGPFSPPTDLADVSTPLAAWSGYTYALRFPDLSPDPEAETHLNALRARYSKTLSTWPDFGQQHTLLTIAEEANP